jgi:citrate lyase subunit beta / citryl-CoA lyase
MTTTYLFAPGHNDRKMARALDSGTDAVVLDLEDSVPGAQKADARRLTAVRIAQTVTASEVWVRINGDSQADDDLRAIDWHRIAGAFVPKAAGRDLLELVAAAGARQIVPIVETAAGLRAIDELASAPRVTRLAIGTFDLALDLGLLSSADPDAFELIWQLRGWLVVASRASGLLPPIDGVYGVIDDDEGLQQRARRARMMGFGAKLIIHPRQMAPVRAAFAWDPADVASARTVVEAYTAAVARGSGAIQVEGRMIDRPVFERARAVLERAST